MREFLKKSNQSELLPKGWIWKIYVDGSGYLVDPEGHHFFNFDCATQEYKNPDSKKWQFMENYPEHTPFKEFQKFAEQWILQNILSAKGSSKYLQVGEYVPATDNQDAIIKRSYYRQGLIYKNEDAFLNHNDVVCYIPELSDATYTRQDFLNLCNGQEEFAKECFYACNWQHPETWFDEQFRENEWGWCEHCQLIFNMEGISCACPKCGADPENNI